MASSFHGLWNFDTRCWCRPSKSVSYKIASSQFFLTLTLGWHLALKVSTYSYRHTVSLLVPCLHRFAPQHTYECVDSQSCKCEEKGKWISLHCIMFFITTPHTLTYYTDDAVDGEGRPGWAFIFSAQTVKLCLSMYLKALQCLQKHVLIYTDSLFVIHTLQGQYTSYNTHLLTAISNTTHPIVCQNLSTTTNWISSHVGNETPDHAVRDTSALTAIIWYLR